MAFMIRLNVSDFWMFSSLLFYLAITVYEFTFRRSFAYMIYGQTDRQTDRVIPIYPKTVFAGV